MALQIGKLVVSGEIDNSRGYSVNGWLQLRGLDSPILVDLTGNCDPDLSGRRLRFRSPAAEQDPTEGALDAAAAESDDFDLSTIAAQQVGPTGTMTTARQAKDDGCPAQDRDQQDAGDEAAATAGKPCLYLEWFSQNGRVVVEIVDPILEFVETEEPGARATDDFGCPPSGLDSAADLDQDDDSLPFEEDCDEDLDEQPEFPAIPDFLQEQLDRDASATDEAIRESVSAFDADCNPFASDEAEKSQAIRELELMDDLIEQGDGVPLDELFDGPLKLPRPDNLADDAEAEKALKLLLAQLALYGVCLHVCEHYTPADTYRLLIEEICPEATAYRELRGTGWVQHYMTSEFCPMCEAEFDREFEESQRRANEEQPPDEGRAADDQA